MEKRTCVRRDQNSLQTRIEETLNRTTEPLDLSGVARHCDINKSPNDESVPDSFLGNCAGRPPLLVHPSRRDFLHRPSPQQIFQIGGEVIWLRTDAAGQTRRRVFSTAQSVLSSPRLCRRVALSLNGRDSDLDKAPASADGKVDRRLATAAARGGNTQKSQYRQLQGSGA